MFRLAQSFATKLNARTFNIPSVGGSLEGRLAMAPFSREAGEEGNCLSESLGPSELIEYPIT